MANIYVASSWRNEQQPHVVARLREEGHEVYDFRNPPNGTGFGFKEIDPNWADWTAAQYRTLLSHPRAEEAFEADFGAMQWADLCVLLLPSGRSAHLEAGWSAGAGKKLLILTRDGEEPELMAKMADWICVSLDEACGVISDWERQPVDNSVIINFAPPLTVADQSTFRMPQLGSERFDGAAAWRTLTAGQQAEIGAIALEYVVTWIGHGAEDSGPIATAAFRTFCAADRLLANQLLDTVTAALERRVPELHPDSRLVVPLPARLGPICRDCGCSNNDACHGGCSWAEPDLCSACARTSA